MTYPEYCRVRTPGGRRSRLMLSPRANWIAHNVRDTGGELWRMDGLLELFADDSTGRRQPGANPIRKRDRMRTVRILPLLALVSLLGCDGTGDLVRGTPAATAYAPPLAGDTTVVTTRRIWSSSGPNSDVNIGIAGGAIMPSGAALAITDWSIGDPGIFDLASREFLRFRFNDESYDTGYANAPVPSPDGRHVAIEWLDFEPEQGRLLILDVATGESRTIMTSDSTMWNSIMPVAWTPAGDSVFALSWPRDQGRDTNVILIPAAGGMPRLVHTIPLIAGSGRVSLSPDGRWLLYDHKFARDPQSRSDIYIIDVEYGGARPLGNHPAEDQVVGWLPGTDVVLFSSDRSGTTDLWSVRVVDGRTRTEPRLVRSDFYRTEAVGFAHGALFYRVQTGSSGPAVIDVDPESGTLRGPASAPVADIGNVYFRALAWSPDGQSLAAHTWGAVSRNRVIVHDMETGRSRAFGLDEGVSLLALDWAADGKALFLRAAEAPWGGPTGPQHFLRLDLVNGTTSRLFVDADPESWPDIWRVLVTPDGRSIVLREQSTLDDGRTEMTLVLRSLEDGSERELHRTSGFIPEFSTSADGTQLAFMQQQAMEESDSLFVLRMDGSQALRSVASWDGGDDPVSLLGWLPAANALLGARLTGDGTGEEILRIDLDGTTTVVGISPFEPWGRVRVPGGPVRSRLLLSPGANRLTHLVLDSGGELWRMDGLPELFADHATDR
jgi:hypothetical protein